MCRDEEFSTIHNKQADRAIRSLHVFCTNKEKGCKWQGIVNDIINHLGNSDGCQFEEVACFSDCGKCLQRQYLTIHVKDECVRRKVDCQYCFIRGEHQFIEGEHKEQCPKLPIACPNKCEADNIPREDIDEHRKMCPLEEVTCPNDCGMILQRQYLTIHIKMECPHLKVDCQYCHITGEHQFIEGEHKEQCPKFPIACPNKCEVGSVPRDDVEEHMKMCPLELIQCEYHVVGCEERMARKEQKKHNKEKMEEHLSFIIFQLTNTQHDSSNGLKELTTQISQTRKDLATTKQDLTSVQLDAVKAIDKLIETLQQTKRDIASQLQENKDELRMITVQGQKEWLDLSLKLQQTENELVATKKELAIVKDNLITAQEEARKTKDDFAKQLEQLSNELKVMQGESKEREGQVTKELTKELDQARQVITSTMQELDVSKQTFEATKTSLTERITATEQELKKNTEKLCKHFEATIQQKLAARLENEFQLKINELEKKLLNNKLFTSPWETLIHSRALNLSSNQNVPVIILMAESMISALTSKETIRDGGWTSESFYTDLKGKGTKCV